MLRKLLAILNDVEAQQATLKEFNAARALLDAEIEARRKAAREARAAAKTAVGKARNAVRGD